MKVIILLTFKNNYYYCYIPKNIGISLLNIINKHCYDYIVFWNSIVNKYIGFHT